MLQLRKGCRCQERRLLELRASQWLQALGSQLSPHKAWRHRLHPGLLRMSRLGLRSRIRTPLLAPSRVQLQSWRRSTGCARGLEPHFERIPQPPSTSRRRLVSPSAPPCSRCSA